MLDIVHLHPMVVHFPVALLLVSAVFEIVYLINKDPFYRRAGFYLFVLGALGVAAAVITGNLAEEAVESEAIERFLEAHEEAGQLTLIIVIITFIVRLVLQIMDKYHGIYQWVFLALFAISLVAMVRTAYLGGELVYTHGAGVQLQAAGAETGGAVGTFQQEEHEEEDDD